MALRLIVCWLGGAVLLTACGHDAQSDSRPAPQRAIAVAPVADAPPARRAEPEITDYTGMPAPRSEESGSKPVWKSQVFARLPSEVLIVDRTRRPDGRDKPPV